MSTLRIRRQIDSATLTLPELQPFLGKTVEIIVRDKNDATISAGTGNWNALKEAAANLAEYDFDAWRIQRELDQQDAVRSLP